MNKIINHKQSKAMGMRYHWLTDIVLQKQFNVYWLPGKDNLSGFHTKHHSAQHHKDMRLFILHQANIINILRVKPHLHTHTYA